MSLFFNGLLVLHANLDNPFRDDCMHVACELRTRQLEEELERIMYKSIADIPTAVNAPMDCDLSGESGPVAAPDYRNGMSQSVAPGGDYSSPTNGHGPIYSGNKKQTDNDLVVIGIDNPLAANLDGFGMEVDDTRSTLDSSLVHISGDCGSLQLPFCGDRDTHGKSQ